MAWHTTLFIIALELPPTMRTSLFIASLVLLGFGSAKATEPAPSGSVASDAYIDSVKPVFLHRCVACHGALKQEAGLRLDTGDFVRKGGDDGAILTPGDSSGSRLIERLSGTDAGERMPPEGSPLSNEEIARIVDWIDAGAESPHEAPPPDPRQHWAFQPPQRSAVPTINNPVMTIRNPIDAFIVDSYQQSGLTPVVEAEPRTLLRRVFLDLIGVPPSPAEMDEFLNDREPHAYERAVDRLLDSPLYAQRWARHWMDVWRYSDWDGFKEEVRESQRHVWRWREWIIAALDQDKPYDQMLMEMLAGDELHPCDESVLPATGFLARNYNKFNRNTWLDSTVEHTSKAFFGLTMNCCRCHDHKYDPIEQMEYYRLRAVFEPLGVRADAIAGETDINIDGLTRVFDEKPDVATYFFVRGDEKQAVQTQPLSPVLPQVVSKRAFAPEPLILTPEQYHPTLRTQYRNDLLGATERDVVGKRTELAIARAEADRMASILKPIKTADEKAAADALLTASPQAKSGIDVASKALIDERFSTSSATRWQALSGDWSFQSDRASQRDIRKDFCHLVSRVPHPRDFDLKLRFSIRGGELYRSVGVCFDAVFPNRFNAVYLSANEGRSGAYLFHRVGGEDIYSQEQYTALSIDKDMEYELRLLVRDKVINVLLNGQFVMAKRLMAERQGNGVLSLWTLDATADVFSCELRSLDEKTAIEMPIGSSSSDGEITEASLVQANARVATAEAALLAAEFQFASLSARLDAEQAAFAMPPAPNAAELATVAAQQERAATVAQAQLALAEAELPLVTISTNTPIADPAALQQKQTSKLKAQEALDSAKKAALESDNKFTPIGATYPASTTGRRLAFAKAAVSPENPLTARVAINHMWLRHFGAALVPTVFDFGNNGKRATHPQLLDWLAVELMENGWHMKPIHRLIVTSTVYRLQSGGDSVEKNLIADRDNRLLWRANVRRMEAESLRDSLLRVSGLLDVTSGGPDLDPTQGATVLRRSIYFRHSKEKRVQFVDVFDGASVTECYRRNETVIPQQALAMMNSRLLSDASGALASSLGDKSDLVFVSDAFLHVLARSGTPEEQQLAIEFLTAQAQRLSGDQLAARRSLVRVLFNHNDFVTIR